MAPGSMLSMDVVDGLIHREGDSDVDGFGNLTDQIALPMQFPSEPSY
jgi:hypothetical protein